MVEEALSTDDQKEDEAPETPGPAAPPKGGNAYVSKYREHKVIATQQQQIQILKEQLERNQLHNFNIKTALEEERAQNEKASKDLQMLQKDYVNILKKGENATSKIDSIRDRYVVPSKYGYRSTYK